MMINKLLLVFYCDVFVILHLLQPPRHQHCQILSEMHKSLLIFISDIIYV